MPKLVSVAANSIADLTDRIQGASPHDIMEVRMMVEPAAAELAALRATAADLAIIEQCNEASKTVDGLKEFEYWDGRLHLEIVKAAKNELLSGIYEAVNSARLQPEWEKMKARSVTPQRRQNYRDHHSELVQALMDRDAKRARQINAYYSQLGEGLLEYVGPLVETHVQEKPLSIALREIHADLLEHTEGE